MFESLQDGIRSALKTLQGKGKLTESNMRDGLALVERSLLEADVSYSVVKDFMAAVTEKALGEKVLLSLDPSQQIVGIVRDELLQILGPVDASLHLNRDVNVLMLCGLQGSGKTTTCGKLARLIQQHGRQCLLVAADLQRPAAVEQLFVIGRQLGLPTYSDPRALDASVDRSKLDPVQVCQDGVKMAHAQQIPVVILDTAGRLAIDQELMQQLVRVEQRVKPDHVYLVVDGMTGQDAVNSAKAFNDALELDGVIMTKLDGDARGGALLSVKHVTGVPIKFIGTGEHLEALEPFRAEGMVSRILGMGDIIGLVDAARQVVDEKQQQEIEARLRAGQFTLDDFRSQLMTVAKPGLIAKMMDLMPGVASLKEMMAGTDAEKDVKRLIGIIDSMTPQERRNPNLIDPSRRNRIAKGAGAQGSEVTLLLKQYDMTRGVMASMAGEGMLGRLKKLRELQTSGLLDPGAKLVREKQGTGKRLTSKEKAELRKKREKDLRRRRREDRGPGG
ncbi:MAG: signal recognition particle protein [Planctomycetes bacterium]|nr:signal recognition particle protein [Planctomycetota bacterium]